MTCGHGDFWGYNSEQNCLCCDEWRWSYAYFWAQIAIVALLQSYQRDVTVDGFELVMDDVIHNLGLQANGD